MEIKERIHDHRFTQGTGVLWQFITRRSIGIPFQGQLQWEKLPGKDRQVTSDVNGWISEGRGVKRFILPQEKHLNKKRKKRRERLFGSGPPKFSSQMSYLKLYIILFDLAISSVLSFYYRYSVVWVNSAFINVRTGKNKSRLNQFKYY